MSTLHDIARQLVAAEKGILAADESTGTIKKRFDKIGVESTEENRRKYRELLFSTPGIGAYISGVIMYDETLRQRASDGHTFVTMLERQGVLTGIKVDEGTVSLVDGSVELVTKGLEGLAKRLPEYRAMDARFAKWRGVYTISASTPSDACIAENAERLAAYAKLCQDNDIVPIVEPEVLMDGDHPIERCVEVTTRVLQAVFRALETKGVDLAGMLLKPNMATPGQASGVAFDPDAIARLTVGMLTEVVPSTVAGIAFLSGGQSEMEACATLNAMNVMGDHPWPLTFSYGRALQNTALKTWGGKDENVEAAQKAFIQRCRLTSLARDGQYRVEMEE